MSVPNPILGRGGMCEDWEGAVISLPSQEVHGQTVREMVS